MNGPAEAVTLLDGSTAELRRVVDGDEEAVRRLFEGLSLESRAKRFMTGGVDLPRKAALVARAGDPAHVAVIASAGGDVLALGQYDVSGPGVAEVAFAVADHAQGHGLGTLLLRRLAEEAQAAGLSRFEAIVLPENHEMLDVFRHSGLPMSSSLETGVVHVDLACAA